MKRFRKDTRAPTSQQHYLQSPTSASSDRGLDKENVVFCNISQPLKKKKNEIMPFAATGMGLEILILSQSNRERQISLRYHSCMESSFKNNVNEHIYRNRKQRTETDSQTSKTSLRLPKRKGRGGAN